MLADMVMGSNDVGAGKLGNVLKRKGE